MECKGLAHLKNLGIGRRTTADGLSLFIMQLFPRTCFLVIYTAWMEVIVVKGYHDLNPAGN